MKNMSGALRCATACLLLGVATLHAGARAADAPAADARKAIAREQAVATYTQDLIDAMDADKNHEVSKAEFLDFMSKEFDRLDVNHDGKLQQSEILNKPMMGQQKSSVSHR